MKNINILKVSAKNFLSIGKNEVSFDVKKGLNIITGENLDLPGRQNGIGKSTLVEILYFSFFGETLREIKNDNIVNNITNKTVEVSSIFEVIENGVLKTYKVVRNLKPSKCFLYEFTTDGKEIDLTRSVIAETNNLIEILLNCSKEVFQNSVVMSVNGTTSFMSKKKIDKRKFIEGILNIEIFSKLLKVAREDANQLQKDILIENTKKDGIVSKIKMLEQQEIAFNDSKIKKIQEYEERISRNKKEQEILTNKIQENKKQLQDSESLGNQLKALNESIEKNSKELETISSNIMSLTENKMTLDKSFQNKKSYEKEKASLTELLNECQNIAKNLEDKIKEVGNIESADDIKIVVENLENKKNIAENEIKTCNSKLVELKSEILYAKREIEKIDQSKGVCEWCKKNIDEIMRPINLAKKNDFETKITGINTEMTALNESIEKYSTVLLKIKDKLNENSAKMSKIKEQRYKLDTLSENKKNNDTKMNQYVEKINKLQNNNFLSEDEYKTQFETIENKLKTLKQDKENINKNIETSKNSISEISITIKKNDAIFSEVQMLTNEFNLCNKWIEQSQKDIENVKNSESPVKNDMIACKEQEKVINEQIVSLQFKNGIVEKAKFLFSEEGAKSYIIKKILNILNMKIDEYLKKMDAPCKVVFDEYFEDKILNRRNIECEYWNFSGAERKSIDLAIMFAFIDLMKLNGNVSFNCLFFDELLDSSMDSKGIDNVINILKDRIDNNSEAIYIVSHRKESIKHVTGEVIFLQKKNGITERKENEID